MKKHNALAIITLVSIFTSCVDDKKNKENLFSIDDSQFKVMYHNNDAVSLTLKSKTA